MLVAGWEQCEWNRTQNRAMEVIRNVRSAVNKQLIVAHLVMKLSVIQYCNIGECGLHNDGPDSK